MNNDMAYIYTGEVTVNSEEVGIYGFSCFSLFYNYLQGVISKKLDVDFEAIELCKVIGDPQKDYLKVSYKLHYSVYLNEVRNAIFSILDGKRGLQVKDISFKATGNRIFNIDIIVESRNIDEEMWKTNLVPATVEKAARKVLPNDLIPKVKFNVTYPVTAMATYTID